MNARISKLRLSIAPDATYVSTNLVNIRYLTGFTGSNAALAINQDNVHLFTDSRYDIQARQETNQVDIHLCNDLLAELATWIETSTVMYEAQQLTVLEHQRLQHFLPKQSLEDSKRVVEKLRIVKDDSEVALVELACSIATSALEQVVHQVRPGLTERDISIMLARTMVDLGADDIAFETIVATGPNSAVPHHSPTDREVAIGDLLKIDFGALLQGYHSDCTRTFVLGKPQSWQIDIFQAVAQAQAAGRRAVHGGAVSSDVVKSVADSLHEHDMAKHFTHGLGHGVGLEIHEDPFLSSKSASTLESGTIVTIEPGVYLENQGGVRIEDTVVVTQDGYRNLTVFHYDLQEIC